MQAQYFVGTRGGETLGVNFQDAILNPTAPYGGLYTLKKLPKFSKETIEDFTKLTYEELTRIIFDKLGLNLPKELLLKALSLYKDFDEQSSPAPLHPITPLLSIQKLYCGPTRAFKDIALQPFGELFSSFLDYNTHQYLILVATSGDTGPATLKSFANRPNIKVVCIYPHNGTSDVQRLQMTTLDADNLAVFGINGNFDDAQNLLKSLLKDPHFHAALREKNLSLSAANSVNFGRIAFQIIYHIYASLQLYKTYGKNIHTIIPSGNFGNALGAFYAKLMGFPIERIWIASNANNILTEFITTGVYDISQKTLKKTCSPAMDILKSSNVERMLYALFDAYRTQELMESLESTGKYALNKEELLWVQNSFSATSCDDTFCLETIGQYAKDGHIIDPHTACGIKAYQTIQTQYPNTPCVLCSTAEWTKFAPTLAKALNLGDLDDREALEKISEHYKIPIPMQIRSLFTQKEIHTKILNKEDLLHHILQWL